MNSELCSFTLIYMAQNVYMITIYKCSTRSQSKEIKLPLMRTNRTRDSFIMKAAYKLNLEATQSLVSLSVSLVVL